MADDRRIIHSSYVIVKESADPEETVDPKWKIYSPINKSLGGGGTITDLANAQWSDQWTSMQHSNMFWEDYADATDVSGNRWEDFVIQTWSEDTATIGTSPVQLVGALTTAVDIDLSFLYIKNVGDYELQLSLNGTGGNYYILIPAGGSVTLRGGDAAFHADDIFVKSTSSSTTIDYIIAIK